MNPLQLATAQAADHDLVVMPSDLPYWGEFKLAQIARQQPDIITLGTSRCGEFRAEMFKPYKFYNACFTAWSFDQQADMLKRILAVSKPKVVILDLDYFMFTNSYADGYLDRSQIFGHTPWIGDALSRTAKGFLKRPQRMFSAAPEFLFNRAHAGSDNLPVLGIEAILNGDGYRWDGSYVYSKGQLAQAPINNADITYGLINAVPGAPQMAQRQIDALARVAKIARDAGVTLIGLQLPFLGTAVEYIDNYPPYHEYAGNWRQFQTKATHKLFSDLGIMFFDLARDPINKDQRYFIDAMHPGEAGTAEALLRIVANRDCRSILPRLDIKELQNTYADAVASGKYFSVYEEVSVTP
jgi:hypothetical protein